MIVGASPALEAANGAFMFPDVYADEPGSSIGIVLMDHVHSEAREQLRKLLEEHTALKCNELLSEDERLGSIGKTIVKGAEYLSKGKFRVKELNLQSFGEKVQ